MEIVIPFLPYITIATGYLLTFWITTLLIRHLILRGKNNMDINRDRQIDDQDSQLIKDGYIIGKCENIIILTFVLADALTGLALIFAAKNIVRKDQVEKNASFFLAGTILNFTASLIMAYFTKWAYTWACSIL